jgi:transcriptional regulator with XRE-family HTH domain
MNVGRAIKLCRSGRNFTQAELSRRAGVSAATISLIETGERDASLNTLSSIALALNVPLEILVFLASDQRELSGLPESVRFALSDAAMSVLSEQQSPSLL